MTCRAIFQLLLHAVFCFASLPALGAESLPDYSRLDQHALAAPSELNTLPQALLAYLLQPAKNDEDKARLLFRWVTNNIEYDMESYAAGVAAPVDVESVLRTRKSLCGGYAALFAELARMAGLEVVSIAGYVKGFSYLPGEPLGEPNHEWNAVKINGRWRLLDPTWGAGGIDETGRYLRRFQPYYFLPEPSQLAWTHWPNDARWRLLEPGLSSEEFVNKVRPTPAFFELGLALSRDDEHTLKLACNQYHVVLSVPDGVALTAIVTQAGKSLAQATLVQRTKQTASIDVLLPGEGEYRLTLYAKRSSESGGSFAPVLTFRLLADRLPSSAARFPESYVTFREARGQLLKPLSFYLPQRQIQFFDLRVPDAVAIAVISGEGQWFKLQRNGERFSGDALVSGATRIVGSFDESGKNYYTLLAFAGVANDALPAMPICP